MQRLFLFLFAIIWLIVVFVFLVHVENNPIKEPTKKVENKAQIQITSQQISRFMQQHRRDKITQKAVMEYIDKNID